MKLRGASISIAVRNFKRAVKLTCWRRCWAINSIEAAIDGAFDVAFTVAAEMTKIGVVALTAIGNFSARLASREMRIHEKGHDKGGEKRGGGHAEN